MPVAQGQDPLKIDLKMEILMLFELKKRTKTARGQTDGRTDRRTDIGPEGPK